MTVGRAIAHLRKINDVEQKELCNAIHISVTYLSLIEHDKARPHIGIIDDIATYLHSTTADIFYTIYNVTPSDQSKEMINGIAKYFCRGTRQERHRKKSI